MTYVRNPSASENDLVLEALRRPESGYDINYFSTGGMNFYRTQMADVVLSLLINTVDYRKKAMSYRGFNVGAGAMLLQGSRVGRVFGINAKFDDTDRVNIHAEDLVIAKATDAGFDTISVLAVIGPTQEDHGSGIIMPTLHPCDKCRTKLADSPLMKDDTILVTARPDFTAIEVATLKDINNAHQNNDPSGINTFYFDNTPDVFSPIPPPVDGKMYRASEIVEVDDSDWQQSIGQLLMARYALTLIEERSR